MAQVNQDVDDWDDVDIVDDVEIVDDVDEEGWGGYCWGDSRLAEATNKWSKKWSKQPRPYLYSLAIFNISVFILSSPLSLMNDDGPSFG